MNQVEKAILRTLCYADVFDYPLTLQQLHRFSISTNIFSVEIVRRGVLGCQQQGLVEEESGRFCLIGRKQIVTQAKLRLGYSKKKQQHAKKVGDLLQDILDLEAVFLTGAVAMDNADKNDDIDLMLVTAPNKLWTVKWQVVRMLDRKGIRRKPGMDQVQDLICPNIFVTTDNLKIPPSKQNLYTAHEVVQVVPIFDTGQIYTRFLQENEWVQTYLANIQLIGEVDRTPDNLQKSPGLTEKIMFNLQHLYMKRRMTTENVSYNSAFFHPRPTNQLVLRAYSGKLKKLDLD